MSRLAMLAAAVLSAGAAGAEAPTGSLLPRARPTEAPAVAEAPGRPEARPGLPGAAAEAPAPPDGAPVALAEPPRLPVPPPPSPAPEATRGFLPAVPRQPPLVASEPLEARFEGLAGVVRAELLMAVAPVAVVVDGWEGAVPPARPEAEAEAETEAGAPAPMRPRARPGMAAAAGPGLPAEPSTPVAYVPPDGPRFLALGPDVTAFAVAVARLPFARPGAIMARAERVRAEALRGQVCGTPAIQGEAVAPVGGGGGCGIEAPVKVRSVDGVRLSTPATVDCATAEALLAWVRDGARPAVGSRGGGLAGLELMGSYTCRPRNNQAGARMSEHGRGRAVDIGAVLLADGSRLSVARDWPDQDLKEMHRAACGIFSTTLGPGSDGYHEDHLHYDTARGRGPYCR